MSHAAEFEQRLRKVETTSGGGSGGGPIVSTDITDSTAAGRAVLTAANAAAQRTALGLGSAALAASSDFAPSVHTHAGIPVSRLVTITVPSVTAEEFESTVTDAAVTATSNILARLVVESADDENGTDELDEMDVFAMASSGAVVFTLSHRRGPFVGPFNVHYLVT